MFSGREQGSVRDHLLANHQFWLFSPGLSTENSEADLEFTTSESFPTLVQNITGVLPEYLRSALLHEFQHCLAICSLLDSSRRVAVAL
jgi:hypothetical protein